MGRRRSIDKEPVKLREKVLKGGSRSLYLDIYDRGTRTYEFLRLYLLPERNDADRAHNENTLALAQQIKARRVLEVQAGAYGLDVPSPATLLDGFMLALAEEREGSTRRVWKSVAGAIKRYDPRHVTMRMVNEKWCRGFIEHLQSEGVGDGTVWKYAATLSSALAEAVTRGIMQRNPMASVKVRYKPAPRQYLTMDELKAFAAVECHPAAERVRRAFVFSALTGLRISDIRELTRDNVSSDSQGRPRLVYKQRKTGKREVLDITPQALDLACDGQILFPLPTANAVLRHVHNIATAAKIEKHISFHTARHTFATMMLTLGADVYTVSKLLGHSSVKTTQVYAKVLDDAKRKAVDLIPDISDITKTDTSGKNRT